MAEPSHAMQAMGGAGFTSGRQTARQQATHGAQGRERKSSRPHNNQMSLGAQPSVESRGACICPNAEIKSSTIPNEPFMRTWTRPLAHTATPQDGPGQHTSSTAETWPSEAQLPTGSPDRRQEGVTPLWRGISTSRAIKGDSDREAQCHLDGSPVKAEKSQATPGATHSSVRPPSCANRLSSATKDNVGMWASCRGHHQRAGRCTLLNRAVYQSQLQEVT